MNEKPGYVIGPESRVVALRSRLGYHVAVVIEEGPFSHDEAEERAAELRRRNSGRLTKAEAAARLGITEKGVDYLRRENRLTSVSQDNKRVLICATSVEAELARRNDG